MSKEQNDTSASEFLVSMREALKQNWEHARHQEIQRQHQLYVFMIVFGGILAFVFDKYVAWHQTLAQFWPVFLFLMLYALFIGSSVTKWNLEFQNHIAHIQHISEKLGLIKAISDKRKGEVEKSNFEGTEEELLRTKKALLNDSMFQGYMGLPLPLPKRVHQNFENIMDIILGGTAFAFLTGLLIASTLFSNSSFYIVGDFVIPFRIYAYVVGAIFGALIVIWNRMVRKHMKENAAKMLDVRKPDETHLLYKGYKPFYESDEKQKYYT